MVYSLGGFAGETANLLLGEQLEEFDEQNAVLQVYQDVHDLAVIFSWLQVVIDPVGKGSFLHKYNQTILYNIYFLK